MTDPITTTEFPITDEEFDRYWDERLVGYPTISRNADGE